MDGTKDFYCDVALQPGAELKKEYESDRVLAYHHTKPFWPVHIVVIPKKHIGSLLTLGEDDRETFLEMIDVIKKISAKVVEEHGAARVLSNLGEYQDSKHLHFHVCFGAAMREDKTKMQ